jgi:hypothetical protein
MSDPIILIILKQFTHQLGSAEILVESLNSCDFIRGRFFVAHGWQMPNAAHDPPSFDRIVVQ